VELVEETSRSAPRGISIRDLRALFGVGDSVSGARW